MDYRLDLHLAARDCIRGMLRDGDLSAADRRELIAVLRYHEAALDALGYAGY